MFTKYEQEVRGEIDSIEMTSAKISSDYKKGLFDKKSKLEEFSQYPDKHNREHFKNSISKFFIQTEIPSPESKLYNDYVGLVQLRAKTCFQETDIILDQKVGPLTLPYMQRAFIYRNYIGGESCLDNLDILTRKKVVAEYFNIYNMIENDGKYFLIQVHQSLSQYLSILIGKYSAPPINESIVNLCKQRLLEEHNNNIRRDKSEHQSNLTNALEKIAQIQKEKTISLDQKKIQRLPHYKTVLKEYTSLGGNIKSILFNIYNVYGENLSIFGDFKVLGKSVQQHVDILITDSYKTKEKFKSEVDIISQVLAGKNNPKAGIKFDGATWDQFSTYRPEEALAVQGGYDYSLVGHSYSTKKFDYNNKDGSVPEEFIQITFPGLGPIPCRIDPKDKAEIERKFTYANAQGGFKTPYGVIKKAILWNFSVPAQEELMEKRKNALEEKKKNGGKAIVLSTGKVILPNPGKANSLGSWDIKNVVDESSYNLLKLDNIAYYVEDTNGDVKIISNNIGNPKVLKTYTAQQIQEMTLAQDIAYTHSISDPEVAQLLLPKATKHKSIAHLQQMQLGIGEYIRQCQSGKNTLFSHSGGLSKENLRTMYNFVGDLQKEVSYFRSSEGKATLSAAKEALQNFLNSSDNYHNAIEHDIATKLEQLKQFESLIKGPKLDEFIAFATNTSHITDNDTYRKHFLYRAQGEGLQTLITCCVATVVTLSVCLTGGGSLPLVGILGEIGAGALTSTVTSIVAGRLVQYGMNYFSSSASFKTKSGEVIELNYFNPTDVELLCSGKIDTESFLLNFTQEFITSMVQNIGIAAAGKIIFSGVSRLSTITKSPKLQKVAEFVKDKFTSDNKQIEQLFLSIQQGSGKEGLKKLGAQLFRESSSESGQEFAEELADKVGGLSILVQVYNAIDGKSFSKLSSDYQISFTDLNHDENTNTTSLTMEVIPSGVSAMQQYVISQGYILQPNGTYSKVTESGITQVVTLKPTNLSFDIRNLISQGVTILLYLDESNVTQTQDISRAVEEKVFFEQLALLRSLGYLITVSEGIWSIYRPGLKGKGNTEPLASFSRDRDTHERFIALSHDIQTIPSSPTSTPPIVRSTREGIDRFGQEARLRGEEGWVVTTLSDGSSYASRIQITTDENGELSGINDQIVQIHPDGSTSDITDPVEIARIAGLNYIPENTGTDGDQKTSIDVVTGELDRVPTAEETAIITELFGQANGITEIGVALARQVVGDEVTNQQIVESVQEWEAMLDNEQRAGVQEVQDAISERNRNPNQNLLIAGLIAICMLADIISPHDLEHSGNVAELGRGSRAGRAAISSLVATAVEKRLKEKRSNVIESAKTKKEGRLDADGNRKKFSKEIRNKLKDILKNFESEGVSIINKNRYRGVSQLLQEKYKGFRDAADIRTIRDTLIYGQSQVNSSPLSNSTGFNQGRDISLQNRIFNISNTGEWISVLNMGLISRLNYPGAQTIGQSIGIGESIISIRNSLQNNVTVDIDNIIQLDTAITSFLNGLGTSSIGLLQDLANGINQEGNDKQIVNGAGPLAIFLQNNPDVNIQTISQLINSLISVKLFVEEIVYLNNLSPAILNRNDPARNLLQQRQQVESRIATIRGTIRTTEGNLSATEGNVTQAILDGRAVDSTGISSVTTNSINSLFTITESFFNNIDLNRIVEYYNQNIGLVNAQIRTVQSIIGTKGTTRKDIAYINSVLNPIIVQLELYGKNIEEVRRAEEGLRNEQQQIITINGQITIVRNERYDEIRQAMTGTQGKNTQQNTMDRYVNNQWQGTNTDPANPSLADIISRYNEASSVDPDPRGIFDPNYILSAFLSDHGQGRIDYYKRRGIALDTGNFSHRASYFKSAEFMGICLSHVFGGKVGVRPNTRVAISTGVGVAGANLFGLIDSWLPLIGMGGGLITQGYGAGRVGGIRNNKEGQRNIKAYTHGGIIDSYGASTLMYYVSFHAIMEFFDSIGLFNDASIIERLASGDGLCMSAILGIFLDRFTDKGLLKFPGLVPLLIYMIAMIIEGAKVWIPNLLEGEPDESDYQYIKQLWTSYEQKKQQTDNEYQNSSNYLNQKGKSILNYFGITIEINQSPADVLLQSKVSTSKGSYILEYNGITYKAQESAPQPFTLNDIGGNGFINGHAKVTQARSSEILPKTATPENVQQTIKMIQRVKDKNKYIEELGKVCEKQPATKKLTSYDLEELSLFLSQGPYFEKVVEISNIMTSQQITPSAKTSGKEEGKQPPVDQSTDKPKETIIIPIKKSEFQYLEGSSNSILFKANKTEYGYEGIIGYTVANGITSIIYLYDSKKNEEKFDDDEELLAQALKQSGIMKMDN